MCVCVCKSERMPVQGASVPIRVRVGLKATRVDGEDREGDQEGMCSSIKQATDFDAHQTKKRAQKSRKYWRKVQKTGNRICQQMEQTRRD